ncbi:MAG: hypothetical protein HKN32_06495, partial [Flavobacteriales bacterium]|nr:hypothetical protein [Flavobacteriales bacterium]
PNTEYSHTVHGRTETGAEVLSHTVMVTTAELPQELQDNVSVAITEERDLDRPGFFITNIREAAINAYFSVAYDMDGNIRWYKEWDLVGGDLNLQFNGNYTAFIGTTTGFTNRYGYYAEFTPGGEFVRRYQAPVPFYTDNHEIILTGDPDFPDAHIMSYDIRILDLTDRGGPSDARVAGHQILRINSAGFVEFMWNIWDHFSLDNWVEGRQPEDCDECDIDHPNSLALDVDGNYIMSIRNFNEVTKINSMTGEVMWRLGGLSNEFTFVDDPENGFSGQHYARILPNGRLLLYDNGISRNPQGTRMVEYDLDTTAMTATMVWEYWSPEPRFTRGLGSVQRLETGHTFVGYGGLGIATEVGLTGERVWEAAITINNAPAFRSYRLVWIDSLYESQTFP